MSLRDGARSVPSKQSPVTRGDIVPFGDCFATCARNDMQMALLRQSPTGMTLQSATGKELRRRRTLLPSVLDKAFKGEL